MQNTIGQADGKRRKKREKRTPFSFGETRWNSARSHVYVMYDDDDGLERYKSKQLREYVQDDSEDERLAIYEAELQLQDFLKKRSGPLESEANHGSSRASDSTPDLGVESKGDVEGNAHAEHTLK